MNEKELVAIIRNSKELKESIETIIEVILDFLAPSQSYARQAPDLPLVQDEIA